MKQSAVGWIIDQLFELRNPTLNQIEIVKKAKEMEKQQQDEFAIDFIKWTISKEADDLIHDLQMVGEVSKFLSLDEVFKVYKRFKKK